jgi:hypothetical protein
MNERRVDGVIVNCRCVHLDSSAHAPEMKPEQKHEQAVTPQREIAPKQEQGEDFGLGL